MMLRPIMNAQDLKGGCLFLKIAFKQFEAYDDLKVISVTKKPYFYRFDQLGGGGQWFFRGTVLKPNNRGAAYDDEFSFLDNNIIPNNYTDSSVWKYNAKTKKFLSDVCDESEEAIKQYYDILARFGLGRHYSLFR